MYHSPAIINPRNIEVVLQCFLLSKLIKELRFRDKLKMQTIIQNLKSSLKKKLFQRYFFNIILFFKYFSCPRPLYWCSRSSLVPGIPLSHFSFTPCSPLSLGKAWGDRQICIMSVCLIHTE